MTSPTLSHDQAYLHDFDSVTDYSGSGDSADPLTGKAFTSDGDIFTITGTCDAAANEWYYRSHDLAGVGLDFSPGTFQNYLVRWKTSDPSAGLGAVVKVEYNGPTYQDLVGDTNPEYSTTWQVTSGTLTGTNNVDKVLLYADDYPDAVAAGSFSVYYDFIMFYTSLFTFPQVDTLDLELENRYADIEIPGRIGDIQQYLGMKSPVIRLSGPMDTRTTWNYSSVTGGDLYAIMKETESEPWQWFTSDLINCKVTPRSFKIGQQRDSKKKRVWTALFKMYSLSGGAAADWGTLQWFGLA